MDAINKRSPIYIIIGFVFLMMFSMPAISSRISSYVHMVLTIPLFIYFFSCASHFERRSVLLMFSVPLLQLIYVLFSESFFNGITSFAWFIDSLVFPFTAFYIIRNKDMRFARIVFYVIFFQMLITSITTIIGCRMFPGVVREITGESSAHQLYDVIGKMNIGGFDFIYSLLLFIPIIFYICSNKTMSTLIRTASFIFLLLALYTQITAEFTTAIVLSICIVVFLLFSSKVKSTGKLVFFSIFAFVILFAIKGEIGHALQSLSLDISSRNVSVRINDIGAVLSGSELDESSDLDGRNELWMRSIQLFAINPFGVWNQNNIGGHSFFLDKIAMFGFLGILLLVTSCRKIYKIYISLNEDSSLYAFLIAIYLLFIVTALVNPHFYLKSITFTLPICFYYLGNVLNEQYMVLGAKNSV